MREDPKAQPYLFLDTPFQCYDLSDSIVEFLHRFSMITHQIAWHVWVSLELFQSLESLPHKLSPRPEV